MIYVAPVLVLTLIILSVFVIWRAVSCRRSLPCPSWLSWMVDNPLSQGRTKTTLRQLELFPGMHVLDAGCGPGRLCVPIAQAVGPEGKVVAVDVQPDMLRRAEAKAARAAVENVQFLHAGLGQGKLPASTFDRAVLVTVLGEIPDRLGALREIYSALKPGGFLLVSEVIGDPHYQSKGKVAQLAREAGFRTSAPMGNWLAFAMKLEKPDGV
jgi:ubiquinone/menaquinone biosynthesis C-methylase UbiE